MDLNRITSSDNIECLNDGHKFGFQTLKIRQIEIDELLSWNSGVELVDRYAAYLNGNDAYSNETICDCTASTVTMEYI
ncbi:unnamed protein product [Didymodactylos carnosus]|uniref:Uncharacterized protein n=1 Tax=Didymodactylos carnosus TaxID=1234261 RepID=A0A815SL11_9BILA|nr:unnamed protein product [Didymodactylos carnosus]CAF1491666.1 unnamed protein product [Didymodactylos carnosus]CAF4227124.1 unnamed protein product [Didymodactylos carnosus]CAF4354692.1 unnamed protein product [Didymodactylos carnosus]